MSGPALDPAPILAALDRHRVAYVLIGGFAAQQHGATRPTEDIDITPAVDADNLGRLAAALRELDARIRVTDPPDGLPFDTSADAMRGMSMLNLRCRHGDFDISFNPAGTAGYPDLIRAAQTRTVDGITIRLASLADIIRSKTAAGRPKRRPRPTGATPSRQPTPRTDSTEPQRRTAPARLAV